MLEQPLDRVADRRWLGEAPHAGQPRGERPDLRVDDEVPELAQGADVALGGLVGPHPGVHGRRHDDRRAGGGHDGGDGARRQPDRQLRDDVGGGRRDDDGISGLGELDVSDLLVGVELHDIGDHRAVGEAGEGERGDERRGGMGEHHVDVRAALHESPDEEDGLVGRDAACHADHDPAPGERTAIGGHRAISEVRAASRARIASQA